MKAVRVEMTAVARRFVHAPVNYTFTRREERVLELFFSNTDKKVFFLTGLPAAACSALLAMYSRLKNPRGLRGHFVDHLVPALTAAKGTKFADLGASALDRFCRAAAEPDYWEHIAVTPRIREFLSMWLDKYGHNSIARTGQAVLGLEDVSILAAKSVEWGAPGSAYIELSTRYVDVSAKGQYPVERELELIDPGLAQAAAAHRDRMMDLYRTLMGDDFDGLFPAFLRQRWSGIVPDADRGPGVVGESCDVLGNLLPVTTLTSLGAAVSGEAFAGLIKHLILDDTPEGDALAELIVSEAGRTGLKQFLVHMDISEWRKADWSYLVPNPAEDMSMLLPDQMAQEMLTRLLGATKRYRGKEWAHIIDEVAVLHRYTTVRSSHDKLPAQFGHIGATFGRTMSFRGWRDLQRQTFCIHHRSSVTPLLGYYVYPKPAPLKLAEAFAIAHKGDAKIFSALVQRSVPATMRQYLMTMGERVTYHVGANLWQWEFCNWQRSKWSVNDEVRQEFLAFEHALRHKYPWWARISRADLTPHYVFARGTAPVVLPPAA